MTDRTWQHRLELLTGPRSRSVSPGARGSRRARRRALVDSTIVALDEFRDSGLGAPPAEIVSALHRISPTAELATLQSLSEERAAGWLNALKGSLFELRVEQAVRSGAIDLPEGVHSFRLVDSFTTPGHDALLLDRSGNLADVVQLKASSNADLIVHHLHVHPQVESVWATTEAAHDAASRGLHGVMDTGISDHDLSASVHGAMHGAHVLSAWDILDEIVPQTALAVIAARLVWDLARRKPVGEALRSAGTRTVLVTVTSGLAGLGAAVTGTELVRIPVVVSVAFLRVVHSRLSTAPETAQECIDRLRSLTNTVPTSRPLIAA